MFLLAESYWCLSTQYGDELFVVSNTVQDLSSDLMRASYILYRLVLLSLLAALLSKNSHHACCVDIFHTYNLESLRGQLLVFWLSEKLIKVFDFANDHFRCQLLILELFNKHRFIESVSFNDNVISLLCFYEKTILGDLEQSFHKILSNLQRFRVLSLQFSYSVDIFKLVFELQEVPNSLSSTKKASLSLNVFLVESYP